jgi:hypothetical protein
MPKSMPLKPKTIISIQDFHDLACKARNEPKSIAPEASPAWGSYCKRTWGAWERHKQFRLEELDALDMLETYEIDYYLKTNPINP